MSDVYQMLCETEEMSADSWGIFSYNDAPAAFCGGGSGCFCWFNSKEDMFKFFTSEDIIGEDADMSKITNKILRDEIGIDDGVMQINQELKGIIQIQWIGQFEQLCNGNNDYAKEVIEQFRQSLNNDRFTPINQSEISAFKEFLEEYGL
ncbi:MAG: hypothetical protein WCL34_07910 [Methylococcaceae bacterium]